MMKDDMGKKKIMMEKNTDMGAKDTMMKDE